LEAKIAEMEEIAIITAEKIDTAAAQKLASMGHGEPLDLGSASITDTKPKTIIETLNELKGAEAAAFYVANRAEIEADKNRYSV